jgi:hypothetical protein
MGLEFFCPYVKKINFKKKCFSPKNELKTFDELEESLKSLKNFLKLLKFSGKPFLLK